MSFIRVFETPWIIFSEKGGEKIHHGNRRNDPGTFKSEDWHFTTAGGAHKYFDGDL